MDQIFPDGRLDLFALFSSSSTATRPAGQVDYIAANEYLNAYAKSRQGSQTRVVAIDWGIWADTGMAADAMARRRGQSQMAEPQAAEAALWQTQSFDHTGAPTFRSRFDARTDWLLNDHRTHDGTALIPGTGTIELIAEGLQGLGLYCPFEIRDLWFLQPFVVEDTTPREAVLQLKPSATGYEAHLHAATADGYARTAEAQVLTLEPTTVTPVLSLDAIAKRCTLREEPTGADRLRSPQEANLRFGPRWHVLQSMAFGQDEGLAHLHLPDLAAQDGTILHPGLLDLATGWAISLAPGYEPSTLWVPVTYGSIRVFAPLPQDVVSHMRLSQGAQTPGTALFDVTICDPSGRILVEIRQFRMQMLEGGFALQAARTDSTAAALGLAANADTQPLSPDERRLLSNLTNGIRAHEEAQPWSVPWPPACRR